MEKLTCMIKSDTVPSLEVTFKWHFMKKLFLWTASKRMFPETISIKNRPIYLCTKILNSLVKLCRFSFCWNVRCRFILLTELWLVFKTSFHPDNYWTSSGLRKRWITVPYIGSMMFYVHAQVVVFSEHAQDFLLFYAHTYLLGESEYSHWWVFCAHVHYHY